MFPSPPNNLISYSTYFSYQQPFHNVSSAYCIISHFLHHKSGLHYAAQTQLLLSIFFFSNPFTWHYRQPSTRREELLTDLHSQHGGSLPQQTSTLHDSPNKHTEATQSSTPPIPQTKDEILDPGSLTTSQIEDDNAYFYGADNPLPTPVASPGNGGMGGKQTASSQQYSVEAYTFSKLPGDAGGTMVTCPSDVAVKTLIAKKLLEGLKVILVGPNSHLYWNTAAVRAVIPNKIPDKDILLLIKPGSARYSAKEFEFVLGKAHKIYLTDSAVMVATNEGASRKIFYDQLVIAKGPSGIGGAPFTATRTYEENTRSLYALQKDIVIAGGGCRGRCRAGIRILRQEGGSSHQRRSHLVRLMLDRRSWKDCREGAREDGNKAGFQYEGHRYSERWIAHGGEPRER